MDISELYLPDTTTIHINFPNHGPLYMKGDDGKDDLDRPVTIDIYSPSSNEVIAYDRKVRKEIQGLVARRGLKAIAKRSAEETEKREIERLCAHTASVNNLVYKGELLTRETIYKLYSDPKMGWLTDQVRNRIGDWEDFLD